MSAEMMDRWVRHVVPVVILWLVAKGHVPAVLAQPLQDLGLVIGGDVASLVCGLIAGGVSAALGDRVARKRRGAGAGRKG